MYTYLFVRACTVFEWICFQYRIYMVLVKMDKLLLVLM